MHSIPFPFSAFCKLRWAGRVARGLALASLLAPAASLPARANDRPFQYARTAIEEDDEQVWSMESWVQRYGTVRAFSIEPEYMFTTRTSLQGELTRLVDRHGSETGQEAELEFKQLFNNIAREGWGWGLSATLSAAHAQASGAGSTLVGLKVPVSLSLWQGEGHLHLDAGLSKASDARRIWTTSAGLEHQILQHTMLFGELAHEGDLKFAQIGVRHWLKREKLALDVAAQQQRSEGVRASGFVIGVGWYDL